MKKSLIFLGIVVIILLGVIVFININARKKESCSEQIIISSYDNPVIPEGFSKLDTEQASWTLNKEGNPEGWNKGLVIEDENQNQFVWVPVINSNFGIFSNEEESLMDNESTEEIDQIKKFGGFFISRFEAGICKELTDNTTNISVNTYNIEGVPVSQKGVIPWNYISLKKAKINAQKMYDNENIKSDLITTRQWLRVLKWLSDTGFDFKNIKNKGNFADSVFWFSGHYSLNQGRDFQYAEKYLKDENIILATGINENSNINNIYDLFGNVMEYTDGYVVDRGYYSVGGYYSESSCLKTAHLLGVKPLDKIGFRIVLYLR